MEEVDVEARHEIGKETIDMLEGLIVGAQRLDQLGRGFHELLGQDGAADIVQQQTPFGDIRSIVWSTEEEDTEGGYVDGSQVLGPDASKIEAVDQSALDDQAA